MEFRELQDKVISFVVMIIVIIVFCIFIFPVSQGFSRSVKKVARTPSHPSPAYQTRALTLLKTM